MTEDRSQQHQPQQQQQQQQQQAQQQQQQQPPQQQQQQAQQQQQQMPTLPPYQPTKHKQPWDHPSLFTEAAGAAAFWRMTQEEQRHWVLAVRSFRQYGTEGWPQWLRVLSSWCDTAARMELGNQVLGSYTAQLLDFTCLPSKGSGATSVTLEFPSLGHQQRFEESLPLHLHYAGADLYLHPLHVSTPIRNSSLLIKCQAHLATEALAVATVADYFQNKVNMFVEQMMKVAEGLGGDKRAVLEGVDDRGHNWLQFTHPVTMIKYNSRQLMGDMRGWARELMTTDKGAPCHMIPQADVASAKGLHLCLGASKLAILAFMAVGGEIKVPIPTGSGASTIIQEFTIRLGGHPDISTEGMRPGTAEHGLLCGQLVYKWDSTTKATWAATLAGARHKDRDPRQVKQQADRLYQAAALHLLSLGAELVEHSPITAEEGQAAVGMEGEAPTWDKPLEHIPDNPMSILEQFSTPEWTPTTKQPQAASSRDTTTSNRFQALDPQQPSSSYQQGRSGNSQGGRHGNYGGGNQRGRSNSSQGVSPTWGLTGWGNSVWSMPDCLPTRRPACHPAWQPHNLGTPIWDTVACHEKNGNHHQYNWTKPSNSCHTCNPTTGLQKMREYSRRPAPEGRSPPPQETCLNRKQERDVAVLALASWALDYTDTWIYGHLNTWTHGYMGNTDNSGTWGTSKGAHCRLCPVNAWIPCNYTARDVANTTTATSHPTCHDPTCGVNTTHTLKRGRHQITNQCNQGHVRINKLHWGSHGM